VIIGGGVALHFVSRALGWRQATTWREAGDRLFMFGAPWQVRAVFFATVGGGSAYHLAAGSYRWFWWLLPIVAGAVLVETILNRRRG
jgi:hypothetical protein